jgi:hypothetical protein
MKIFIFALFALATSHLLIPTPDKEIVGGRYEKEGDFYEIRACYIYKPYGIIILDIGAYNLPSVDLNTYRDHVDLDDCTLLLDKITKATEYCPGEKDTKTSKKYLLDTEGTPKVEIDGKLKIVNVVSGIDMKDGRLYTTDERCVIKISKKTWRNLWKLFGE